MISINASILSNYIYMIGEVIGEDIPEAKPRHDRAE